MSGERLPIVDPTDLRGVIRYIDRNPAKAGLAA
jgi:hypothetical protein